MKRKPIMVITVNVKGEIIKENKLQAIYKADDINDSTELVMAYIPMGDSPFFIGKYPITQTQWQAVMGDNPSYFEGENRPVEQVSCSDAIEFCQRLSEKVGKEYRLPTEIEWKYACRAGTTTPFSTGEVITIKLANYKPYGVIPGESPYERTTDVGSYPPNAFGLYDMHGNVWEWCANGDDAITVQCGGSWDCLMKNIYSTGSFYLPFDQKRNETGFRVAKSLGNMIKTEEKKSFFLTSWKSPNSECEDKPCGIVSQFALI